MPILRRSPGQEHTVARPGTWHVHRFRWVSDDPFGGSSLYLCRCGVARPGL